MFIAPMGYFPVLIPLHLALVSAILAIATYTLSVLSERRPLSIWGTEIKLIMWLVAFAIISIPFSRWRGGSYELLFDVYLKSVIVFFLIANIMTSERRLRGFLWALTIYCAINSLVGINDYRTGALYQGRIKGAGYSGLTANPNDLALSLNLIIPFMWYLIVTTHKRLPKMIAVGSLALSIMCIVITYSRGGAITLFSILLFFILTRSGKSLLPSLLGAVFVIAVIMSLAPEGYSDRLASTTDFSKDDGSASARWQLMIIGLRQSIEHPFGVGLGMNDLIQFDQGLGWSEVHNVYLQISSELGIIPAVLFVILIWKLIVSMRKIKDADTKELGTYLVLARATQASLVAFAVAGMFHPVAYNFYFYIIAGIAVALNALSARFTSGNQIGTYHSTKKSWDLSFSG